MLIEDSITMQVIMSVPIMQYGQEYDKLMFEANQAVFPRDL